MFFCFFLNGFVDKNATVPNFSLVNQMSLDKILKAEVFIHSEGQLRVAHLILDYTPISKSYQASKCVINAKDPRLHRISIVASGFLIAGPILEGMLTTNPIPEGIPKVALPSQYTIEETTSSHPAITKEEDEKEEEVVEVSDSEDEFEVFNQPLSPKASTSDVGHPFPTQSSHHQGVTSIPDDIGIQCKPRSTLQELLKSQPEGNSPRKVAQTRLTTPPPTQPFRPEPANLKRKREQKGKEVVEGGKAHPSQEGEAQRRAKQARIGQMGPNKRSDSQVEPPSWTPLPDAGWSSFAHQCLHQGLLTRKGRLYGQCSGASTATP